MQSWRLTFTSEGRQPILPLESVRRLRASPEDPALVRATLVRLALEQAVAGLT